MALNATNLLIQMAQLPATFTGSPQDLAAAMVRRMRIVSPAGSNFFVTGSVEPTSNVGPWLKNGTQWFVWSDSLKRYVPLDISASFTPAFWAQSSTPPSSDPPVWLRTTRDPTDVDPSIGDAIGWYEFNGANWVPFNSVPRNGPTSARPGPTPVDFQQYFDTSINCLIHWERGIWRTVSGTPGDIKYVAFNFLADALTANPGWDLFGANNQNFRGRIIMEAASNSDGSNPVTVDTNVAVRRAGEFFGESDGVKIDNTSTVPYPPQVAQWCLVKL